jgi:hypothetical protein
MASTKRSHPSDPFLDHRTRSPAKPAPRRYKRRLLKADLQNAGGFLRVPNKAGAAEDAPADFTARAIFLPDLRHALFQKPLVFIKA